MKVKIKKLWPYCLVFFVPILIFAVAILCLPLFGISRSILYQDPNAQYLDFLNYYKRLITGEVSPLFSFMNGMGEGTLPLIAYYLMSPFNLIVLLFPNNMVAFAYILIIALKIGTAGVTSFIYFKSTSKIKSAPIIVLLSFCYTLSAWTLSYFFHFEWLDAVIMLPLMCLGIDRIIQRKAPLLYIVSLALGLIVNYYTGYMLCVFSVIYFIFRAVNADRRLQLRTFLNYAASSVISGGLVAIVLVPVLMSMLGGGRVSSEALTMEARFPVINLFEQLTSNSSFNSPMIYIGIIGTLIAALYFINTKISRKEKISTFLVLVIFLLSTTINIFAAVWHAGSLERGAMARWTFVAAFFLTYLVMRNLEEMKGLNKNRVSLVLSFIVLLYLIVMRRETEATENFLMIVDFLCLGLAWWILTTESKTWSSDEKKIKGLLLINTVGIVIFAIFNMAALGKLEGGIVPLSRTKQDIGRIEKIVDEVQKINPNELYRIEKTFTRSENDGMQFGYNGISNYNSSSDETKGVLLNYFGLNLRYGVNTIYDTANNGEISYGEPAPLTITTLLGIKYVISEKKLPAPAYEQVAEAEGLYAYRYNYSAGLGMISNNFLAELSERMTGDEPSNKFENINYLISQITDKDLTAFKEISDYKITTNNLTTSGNFYKKIDESEDGTIVLSINNPTKSAVYMYAPFDEVAGVSAIHTSEVTKIVDGKEEHLSHLQNALLSLGNDERIEVHIKLFTDELTTGGFTIYYEDEAVAQTFYESVMKQPVTLRMDGRTKVVGDFTADVDAYLFLTIPYDKNWKISIDGVEMTASKTVGNFTLVPVKEGEHKITLEYQQRGLKAGAIISLISVGMLIAQIVWARKGAKLREQ